MKNPLFFAASFGLCAALCASAQTSMSADWQLHSASALLESGINAKNATPGEAITAKLTSAVKSSDGVDLRKGTVLVGTVQQVQASHDGSVSKISVVFDHAQLADGKTVPVKATLLAAYPSDTQSYYVDTTNAGSMVGELPRVISQDQKIDQEPGSLGSISMHSSVQSANSAVFMDTKGNVNLKRGTVLQVGIAPEESASQS